MRHNGYHASEDPEVVRRLIAENPWGILVSHATGGLVASHYPMLLEEGYENLAVLGRLVEHFERHVAEPMLLEADWARPIARGTVGIRLPITRFVRKIKLSQDKDPVTQGQVIDALRAPGPYHHPGLADDMTRTLSGS
jgi:predicted FMN-binding regulatory protein PaiB